MSVDTESEERTNFWAAYNAARGRLEGAKREHAETLQAQAISYVWGFQDAGGKVHDTGQSWQFGNAYGLVAARYELGEIGSRPPIRDAWQSWQKCGEIWGYSAGRSQRLDDPELPPGEVTQPVIAQQGKGASE